MKAFGNLLRRALTVIPKSSFEYRRVVSVSTNSIGNSIATFSEWTSVLGAVQPGLTFSFNARGISSMVDILQTKKIGIDISKDMITVFVKGIDLVNVHFKEQPDQIRYDGRTFNIISISNWFPYDDWKSLVCVEDTRYTEEARDALAEALEAAASASQGQGG